MGLPILCCSGAQKQRGLATSTGRMGVNRVAVIGSGLMGSGIAQVRLRPLNPYYYPHLPVFVFHSSVDNFSPLNHTSTSLVPMYAGGSPDPASGDSCGCQ